MAGNNIVSRKLNVAHISVELKGLGNPTRLSADIARKLPIKLRNLGINSYIISPMHPELTERVMPLMSTIALPIDIDDTVDTPKFYTTQLTPKLNFKLPSKSEKNESVPLYLVGSNFDLGQEMLNFTHPADIIEKLAFFTLGAIEIMKAKTPPDIIVCHDWQTSFMPAYLKSIFKNDPVFQNTKILFAMHDITYQGNYDREHFHRLGLGWHLSMSPLPKEIEHYGQVSLLKAGLSFSDMSYVRSEEYLNQIQKPHYGHGFHDIIKELSSKNMIVGLTKDDSLWDPSKEFSLKTAEIWAKGQIGLFRSMFQQPFKGMLEAKPSYPNTEWLFLTGLEKLDKINPKIRDLYYKATKPRKEALEKLMLLEQEHIFKNIQSRAEFRNTIDQLTAIGLDWIKDAKETVLRYVRTEGRSSIINGTMEVIKPEELPKVPAIGSTEFNELVQIGKKRKQDLGVLALAGGAGTRFGVPVKGLYEIEALSGKSFLELIIDDTIKAQEKEDTKIPLFVLTSPHKNWDQMREYAENKLGFDLIRSKSNEHLWFYKNKKTGVDMIMFEFKPDKMRPKFDTQGKIIMAENGKDFDLSPAGHGIVFDAWVESGAYKISQEMGVKDLFISNIDNMGRDISSDYYSAILGMHSKNDSGFTVEMVDPALNEPPGGNPVRVNGKGQIGEQFILPQNIKNTIMQGGITINPVNYTLNLESFEKLQKDHVFDIDEWTFTPQWVEKKDPGDKHPGKPYYQLMLLAGDYSTFQEPLFIRVNRNWRFSPTKKQHPDIDLGVESYNKKWDPEGDYK